MRYLAVLAIALTLAACGGGSGGRSSAPAERPTVGGAPSSQSRGGGRSIYKIGSPYSIAGVRHTPKERFNHQETGHASWYGPGFDGRQTANGEIFDKNALTAAHRTLQMPSIIRVTNVGNGRSVVLRVNDRGPYHGDRVLDVSEAAAEELGFKALGTALVRIEVLERPSRLAAITARAGAPIEQLEAIRADAESGRTPAATPPATALASIGRDVGSEAPPADVDIAFVQTGAFGEYSNARRAVARVSAIGEADIVPTDINGDRIYRVRLGPYNGIRAAEGVLVEVTRLGVQGAHIVVVR